MEHQGEQRTHRWRRPLLIIVTALATLSAVSFGGTLFLGLQLPGSAKRHSFSDLNRVADEINRHTAVGGCAFSTVVPSAHVNIWASDVEVDGVAYDLLSTLPPTDRDMVHIKSELPCDYAG
jgi:hypothetical protein